MRTWYTIELIASDLYIAWGNARIKAKMYGSNVRQSKLSDFILEKKIIVNSKVRIDLARIDFPSSKIINGRLVYS